MPFQKPNLLDRLFNRAFGVLVRLGFGFAHTYLLEVRGRKSGRLYATPVDLLTHGGRQYLVAPRGHTQWVRNAEVAGVVRLRKGRQGHAFRLRALSEVERPPMMSIPMTLRSRFMALASNGCMVVTTACTMVACQSRSA
jgi:deazaflavin-dependent oxidoreductase (nitroreductase family)